MANTNNTTLITDDMLLQLRQRFPKHTHIARDIISKEDWEKLNKPCVWHVAEESAPYLALIDSAYDIATVFKQGQLLGANPLSWALAHVTTTSEVILLDMDFYEVPKMIWR